MARNANVRGGGMPMLVAGRRWASQTRWPYSLSRSAWACGAVAMAAAMNVAAIVGYMIRLYAPWNIWGYSFTNVGSVMHTVSALVGATKANGVIDCWLPANVTWVNVTS